MSRRQGYALNVNALQNHLGVTRRMANDLDRIAQELDLRTTSLYADVRDDVLRWQATDTRYPNINADSFEHGITVVHGSGVTDNLVVMFTSPWRFILKSAPDFGHCVYSITTFSFSAISQIMDHRLPNIDGQMARKPRESLINKPMAYVGKTSKGLVRRLKQHVTSAFVNESMTRFHRVMRGDENWQSQWPQGISLIGQYPSEDAAYEAEARHIARAAEDDRVQILNTTGSRDAWMKLPLREQKHVSAEHAEEWLVARSSAAKQMWENPETAEAIICNNPRNFNADDVRLIRFLSMLGTHERVVANNVGASVDRVRKVLAKRTYRRIL